VSARPAILFSVLLAVLLPYYFTVDRHDTHEVKIKQERANVLELDAVSGMVLRRGAEQVRFTRTSDGKLYQIVAPSGAFAPQDLMNALTALFLSTQEVEIVASNTDNLAQYGLDHPYLEVEIDAPGKQRPLKLQFGAENPTHTAFYAKLADSPKIFLMGLDLKYYQELIFEWVEGKHGKKAA
jgi:hypothetical protein